MTAIGSGAVRQVDTYHLNEDATYAVIMKLRTKQAVAVQKQMIAVFGAYRKGLLVPAQTAAPALPPPVVITEMDTPKAQLAVVDQAAMLRWEIESERSLRLSLIKAYTQPRMEQIFGLDYVKRNVEQEFARLSARSAEVLGPKVVLLSDVLVRAGYPRSFVDKNESSFGRVVAPKYREAHGGANPITVQYKN